MKKRKNVMGIISLCLMFVNCTIETVPEYLELLEEKTMPNFTVSPLEEFEKYYVEGGRIFGIPESTESRKDLVEIVTTVNVNGECVSYLPGDFRVVNGVIYFNVFWVFQVGDDETEPVKKWFKQIDGVLTEIDEADIPEDVSRPAVTLEHGDYKIKNGINKGVAISELYYKTLQTNYMPIADYMITGNGLLYYASGSSGARLAGVYFWPIGDVKAYYIGNGKMM